MQKIKATLTDLITASENLSSNDLADFNAMQDGRDPVEVFTTALDDTTHTITDGRHVLAVGGHTKGGVWFVTTKFVSVLSQAERFSFYRIIKKHLAEIRNELPNEVELTNFVALHNHAHIRLLTKLGAVFSEGLFKAPSGLLLKRFWL
ncbi:phage protein Gp13 family protein [Pseudomonas petrae]|uniref:phage protein Gp13 family protein n=1 Tax=Pseudomonas petrae TaxID=2912190 RepID=UPI001EEF8D2F|nr:phage protein Gp13 family protein [Pseudomonas petrae]MCF7532768.1 DUF2833 domain-containing protein [Pseudomonas petrae]MCF7557141.1 DUF2833 domain-containing protein [Pseudomonas petrae]